MELIMFEEQVMREIFGDSEFERREHKTLTIANREKPALKQRA
jgi:hypothetical protein